MSAKPLSDRSEPKRKAAIDRARKERAEAYRRGWNARVDGRKETEYPYGGKGEGRLITAWLHGYAEAGVGLFLRIPEVKNA